MSKVLLRGVYSLVQGQVQEDISFQTQEYVKQIIQIKFKAVEFSVSPTTHHFPHFPCLQIHFQPRLFCEKTVENKFMGKYPELASKFNKSPSSMICDSVPMAQLYHTLMKLS